MNMHHPEMALAARHVVAEAAKGWKVLSSNYFRGLRTAARNRKDALVQKEIERVHRLAVQNAFMTVLPLYRAKQRGLAPRSAKTGQLSDKHRVRVGRWTF